MAESKWNTRHMNLTEETTKKVLWKDADIPMWLQFNDRLHYHLKCVAKLGISSQSAIMEKIIYKHHNQMRRDKPFQSFKKTTKLIHRFTESNLIEKLTSFQKIFQELKTCSNAITNHICIPSVDFTKLLLNRTLGVSKLAALIIVSCQDAYILLDSHMRHGFFVPFNLFAIASVSRIWVLFNEVLHILTMVYIILLEILKALTKDSTVDFPISLDDWLKEDLKKVLPNDAIKIINSPSVNKEIKPDMKSELSTSITNTKLKEDGVGEMLEDIGEPISLEDFRIAQKLAMKFDEVKDNQCSIANEITTNTSTNKLKCSVELINDRIGGGAKKEPPTKTFVASCCVEQKKKRNLKCPLCRLPIRSKCFSLSRSFGRNVKQCFNYQKRFANHRWNRCDETDGVANKMTHHVKDSEVMVHHLGNPCLENIREEFHRKKNSKMRKGITSVKCDIYSKTLTLQNVKHALIHTNSYQESRFLLHILRQLKQRKLSKKCTI